MLKIHGARRRAALSAAACAAILALAACGGGGDAGTPTAKPLAAAATAPASVSQVLGAQSTFALLRDNVVCGTYKLSYSTSRSGGPGESYGLLTLVEGDGCLAKDINGTITGKLSPNGAEISVPVVIDGVSTGVLNLAIDTEAKSEVSSSPTQPLVCVISPAVTQDTVIVRLTDSGYRVGTPTVSVSTAAAGVWTIKPAENATAISYGRVVSVNWADQYIGLCPN